MRVEMILDGDFYEIKNKIVETFPNLIQLSFDGEEQDKWVSVEDRLPERLDVEDDEYIVQVGNAELATVAGFDGVDFYPLAPPNTVVEFEDKITHWQPLPEPPKGE